MKIMKKVAITSYFTLFSFFALVVFSGTAVFAETGSDYFFFIPIQQYLGCEKINTKVNIS
jgi:hypothetical protein